MLFHCISKKLANWQTDENNFSMKLKENRYYFSTNTGESPMKAREFFGGEEETSIKDFLGF